MVNHQTRTHPLTGNIWRISDNPSKSTYKCSHEQRNPTLNEWFTTNQKQLARGKTNTEKGRKTNSNIMSATNYPTNSLAGGSKTDHLSLNKTDCWDRWEESEKLTQNWPNICQDSLDKITYIPQCLEVSRHWIEREELGERNNKTPNLPFIHWLQCMQNYILTLRK